MHDIEARLAELRGLGLHRRLRLISGPQGPRVLVDGRPALLLCSNNYLGLADHPRVREAAADAAMRWGVGAGASRLVSGTMTIHRRLEERLAAFKGSPSCVLFGSGYLANVGVITALAGAGDVIFSDELNHASIVDGCRLSGAQVVVYRHRDVAHLEWCLRRHGGEGEPLIVTDSVFSMDGHLAPLVEIAELAERFDSRFVVDEAHATGAIGPAGRGAIAAAGLEGRVDVLVGTLGKALGSYGAFVCASEATVEYLVNRARPLIFSTAPAPPAVAAAHAALELLEERPQRIERLRAAARALRRGLAQEGFAVEDGDMHIVPLVIGDEREATALCEAAIERGVFAQAIRPPSVPAGTARLRMTVMCSHTGQELRGAARALGRIARESGLDPGTLGSPDSLAALEAPASEPAAELAHVHRDAFAHSEQPYETPSFAGDEALYDLGSGDHATELLASDELLTAAGDESLRSGDPEATQELELEFEQRAAAPAFFDLEREGGLRDAA